MNIIEETGRTVLFESGLELIAGSSFDTLELEFETESLLPIICNLRGNDYSIGNMNGIRIITLSDPDGNIIHIIETGDKSLKLPGEMGLEYSHIASLCSKSGYMFENEYAES